jgi:hypothetical protein
LAGNVRLCVNAPDLHFGLDGRPVTATLDVSEQLVAPDVTPVIETVPPPPPSTGGVADKRLMVGAFAAGEPATEAVVAALVVPPGPVTVSETA